MRPTDLWHWTADRNGTIIGQCRNSYGSLEPDRVSITGEHFPHDYIEDRVAPGVGGALAELGQLTLALIATLHSGFCQSLTIPYYTVPYLTTMGELGYL